MAKFGAGTGFDTVRECRSISMYPSMYTQYGMFTLSLVFHKPLVDLFKVFLCLIYCFSLTLNRIGLVSYRVL